MRVTRGKLYQAILWSVVLLAALMQPATAAVYPPDPQYVAPLAPIYPYRGTYYDPHQAGTGLQVDVGLNGHTFIAYYSYSLTGQPDWYLVAGDYQPSDEVTRWTTGVIGTVNGQFYQAFNGQCLGCDYKPTGGAVLAGVNPTLMWINSREVIMTANGQTWDFIAPNFEGRPDGDYLIGNWMIHIVQTLNLGQSNQMLHDGPALISIASAGTASIPIASTSVVGLTPYKPGDSIYTWTCIDTTYFDTQKSPTQTECDEAFSFISLGTKGNLVFWFDPASDRLGADLVQNGSIGPANVHLDLYVQGPNLITGRGIVEGTVQTGLNPGTYGLARNGSMNIEIIMQRIADSTVGYDDPDGANVVLIPR